MPEVDGNRELVDRLDRHWTNFDVNREMVHHSAAVLELLDLYRCSEGGRAFARPEEAAR